MFVSVKERARQIANGQFTASTTTAPVASPVDRIPDIQPVAVGAPKKISTTGSSAKNAVSHSKAKSKTTTSKEQATPPEASASPKSSVNTTPSKPASTSEAAGTNKKSVKSKTPAESPAKSVPSRTENSKLATRNRVVSQTKTPTTPKVASPAKAASTAKTTSQKNPLVVSKNKRSRSPPKRVDSPIDDDSDPLSSLKSDCLKQVSGVTGLGGRRLAIVLKQRSSGEWYAALKDLGSGKYLKMWMNKDKTYASKEEALEAYLVFVSKMRNEVRWFPMSPRASSPKGKGQ